MTAKNIKIWIWLQDGKPMKAITNIDRGVIEIFDDKDNLILKRTGLNHQQMKKAEEVIIKYGAKRLDEHKTSFRYL
jgi:hypothetical protein